MGTDLFSIENLASMVVVPKAPELVPHNEWPYPGLTPTESAQAALAISKEYADMLSAVIHQQGRGELTGQQILALVPQDWLDATGRFAHGSIGAAQGKSRGIQEKYVSHDGGGFHFTYQVVGIEHARTPAFF